MKNSDQALWDENRLTFTPNTEQKLPLELSGVAGERPQSWQYRVLQKTLQHFIGQLIRKHTQMPAFSFSQASTDTKPE